MSDRYILSEKDLKSPYHLISRFVTGISFCHRYLVSHIWGDYRKKGGCPFIFIWFSVFSLFDLFPMSFYIECSVECAAWCVILFGVWFNLLWILNNDHSAFTCVSPLLFLNLVWQFLHRKSFQIPLGVLSSLDDNVGLLLHSASQLDDLFEAEVVVNSLTAFAPFSVCRVQVRTSIPSVHTLSDFFNVFHFVFVVLDLYSREKDVKVFQFFSL